MVSCAGCNGYIQDRYLMKVLNKPWHSHCLVCGDCGAALSDKCYTRSDGQFYCKEDFFKRFGTNCAECGLGISPSDNVRRTNSRVYHVHCFSCSLCSRQLVTGEELYTLSDNKFVCKACYNASKISENEVHSTTSDSWPDRHSPHHSPSVLSPASVLSPVVTTTVHESPNTEGNIKGEDEEEDKMEKEVCSDNDNNNSPDTQVSTTTGKRRGPRTTIKSKQLEILKDAFSSTPKPTRHIREQLAAKTGLNMRVIQVWFQNKRSKERRMKQMDMNRGRFGGTMMRDHGDDFSYVQDSYYRMGEHCYYNENHTALDNTSSSFMQCLLPPLDSRAIPPQCEESWRHYHEQPPHKLYEIQLQPDNGVSSTTKYPSVPLTSPSIPYCASPATTPSTWSSMIPDCSNQLASQT